MTPRRLKNIYVLNRSTLVTSAEVRDWCTAVSAQLRMAAGVWGQPAMTVKLVNSTFLVPSSAWVIVVMDDADQAGALGYHTVDSRGRVYGKVFVRTALKYNESPSVTFSHEVLETWGDPMVNQSIDTGNGYDVPLELCDAVEGDSYPITVIGSGNVMVSNYLAPAWFGLKNRDGSTFRDYLRKTPGPFTLAPGGYTVRAFPGGRTDQVFGSTANTSYITAKRHELSRTTRRLK